MVLAGASFQREIMGNYVRIHQLEEIGEDEAREVRDRLARLGTSLPYIYIYIYIYI